MKGPAKLDIFFCIYRHTQHAPVFELSFIFEYEWNDRGIVDKLFHRCENILQTCAANDLVPETEAVLPH